MRILATTCLTAGVLLLTGCRAQDARKAPVDGTIAFNRGGSILQIDLATGTETVLVAANDYDRPLAWLPDGERLVYWNHAGGAWDLWTVDATSRRTVNLTRSASDSRSAVGSADGRRIAFMRGGRGVWMMDADGGNQVQLDPRGHRDAPPAWSPSGNRLAFTDLGDGASPMVSYVVELDGGAARSVRELGAGEVACFVDERHVLLQAAHQGAYELVVVDIASGARTALTKSAAFDRNAVLSPDRSRIAWVESSDTESVLRLMNADGSEARTLAPVRHHFAPPSFSPDGRLLAFESGDDRKALQVFVVPTAGGPARAVTTAGGSFPVFQPRPH